MNGVWRVAVAVGTMLIAFVSVIAMVVTPARLGETFGFAGITLQAIFGYLFSPLAWLIGIPSDEVLMAALHWSEDRNERVCCFHRFRWEQSLLSEHSQVIVTFALCGFANIGSIAPVVLSVMAPERRAGSGKLRLESSSSWYDSQPNECVFSGYLILL